MADFEDIGSHARLSAYDDCKHVKCEVCKVPPFKQCVNPVTGKPRHLPCIGRIPRLSMPGGTDD